MSNDEDIDNAIKKMEDLLNEIQDSLYETFLIRTSEEEDRDWSTSEESEKMKALFDNTLKFIHTLAAEGLTND